MIENSIPTTQEAPPQKNILVWLVVIFIVAVAALAAGYLFGSNRKLAEMPQRPPTEVIPPGNEGAVACTMDAKLCPDGSSVGRVAPNCEFALCPGEGDDSLEMQSFTHTTLRFSFEYPISYQVIRETPTGVVIGVNGVSYLEITNKKTVDHTKLPACGVEGDFPCLADSVEYNQQSQIEKITVDGKPAESFYISTGPIDANYHFVQTVDGTFEATMNVSASGQDVRFATILKSIRFP